MAEQLGSFADEDVQRCPFPLIAALHREAPVYRDPGTGFYIVARYDDIGYVSEHPEIFSNRTTILIGGDKNAADYEAIKKLYAEGGFERVHTLVSDDPPTHTRHRAIVDKVFTAAFVKHLEPYITALCDELIDAFAAAGTTDLIQNYCIKIPMYVIADQLGVPRHKWQTFKLWSDTAIALINPALSSEERIRLVKIHIEMQQYLSQRMDEYRAAPTDNFLSRLANAELDGEYLSRKEFVSIAEAFLVAGNETTTGGIGHAVATLIRDPELMATLRADPSKMRHFVEEVLRLHAPSPHLYRLVLRDTELSGVPIPKGSIVMLSYLAGNYDPTRFACPEKLDLQRPGVTNHLAFGRGIHYCIGNLLARAEMRIATARLLERLDDIRFDPAFPEPRYATVYHIHQLDSLHIAFTAKRRGTAA